MLILCGHGSSFNLYKQDFMKNHQLIEKTIHANCSFCFIEKNEPNIENCLQNIKKKGEGKIFFFPFLLFNGEHFEKDIKIQIKKLSRSLKLEIKLIEKISLIEDILPIMKKKISKILKKDKLNILVTFSSRSKNSKVSFELKQYTKKLAKNLNIFKAYSYFVGEETKFVKETKNLKSEDYFFIFQPIFLFKGYLQNKNLNSLKKLECKDYYIFDTLMTIDEIKSLVANRLKSIFHIAD